jgi:hypothetical protein
LRLGNEQEIEMRTIKTIPTLLLAASLGVRLILWSDAAVAGNNGHQDHSDHQDHNDHQDYTDHQEHNGLQGGNANRSSAPQAMHVNGPGKKDEGKTKASATDTAGAITFGGKPPRTPEKTTASVDTSLKSPAGGTTPAATAASATGTAGAVTFGGKPPRTPETTPASADTSPKSPAGATPPATTAASVITGGTPPRSPAPTTTPPSAAVVSNGQVKLYIPNSPSGSTVKSNEAGTITVSNGDPTHSVTLPGGSVTISGGGVLAVGGAPGVQVVSHPNGDFVAVATTKSTPPAPPTVTVTGGPEGGFLHALGSGVEDFFDPHFKATAVNPPPATGTSIQE